MYDVVIVGSGINSLVCAAELTAKGRRVLILEREEVAGGCIRTAEAIAPGFHHDLFAMSYPMLVAAPFYPTLKPKLDAEGIRMISAAAPTGVLLPDGRSLLLRQSRQENVETLDAVHDGDGAAYALAMAEIEADAPLIFGLLGQEPRSVGTFKLLAGTLFRRKLDGMATFGASGLLSARDWLEGQFQSDLVRALIAPWVLHIGLGPESSFSAMMAKIVTFTLERVGIPFVEGGGANLVEAFRRIIERGGGAVITGADVTSLSIERGTARGVVTADGRRFAAKRAVVCNMTPTQLYGRLLGSEPLPATLRSQASAYRYGRSCMQIHITLSEPPRWRDSALGQVGLLHLTPGLDAVSRAVNEADRGLLPAEATIVLGQPAKADPSRCPPGCSILWIQLQELPRSIRGDAAGEIGPPADGRWNDGIAEAYANRILKRLAAHIPNLESAMSGIKVLGPHALEAHNINLVGGDPYSGVCSVDQFHLLRPFAAARGHTTPIRNLYHIGASTHPGPGLGGASGHLAAAAIG